MPVISARAGIHRGYEHEVGRIFDRVFRPRYGHASFLHRLAQRFDQRAAELGQLVEKQNSVMREGYLSRLGRASAADQRDARGQVVRGSERALSDQSAACSDASGHRVDFRRLERLVERHRRHDRRQPPGEHRFARARRTDHQHVVASGRGDFERSLGDPLSLDVAEIGFVGFVLLPEKRLRIGLHGLEFPVSAQKVDDFPQVGYAIDVDRRHDGRFRGVLPGQDHARESLVAGRESHRQGSSHGQHRAVERQLAHHDIPREPFGGQLLGRGQNTQRNGQVVGRSLLADVGRRKVDDDFLAAHFVRAVLECGPDAFLTFSDRVIGQADQIHADAGRDIDLCGDRQRVDTEHRAAMAFDEHTGEMICDTSLGICDLLQVKIREFAENSKWPAALVAQSRRGRP